MVKYANLEMVNNEVTVSVLNQRQVASTDIEKTIYELNRQIYTLSSHADQIDYFIAVASGVICSMMGKNLIWLFRPFLLAGLALQPNHM